MFKSFLKSTFRNLWRNRLYTFINVLGLAVGLAGFMLITIYISGELSYDRHHPDAANTYRVAMNLEMSGNITEAAVSGGTLGLLMNEEIKEVASYTRLVHYPRPVLFTVEENKIYFDDIIYADSSFFEFFQYDVLMGDAGEALREPFSLVLTRSGAEKLFGEDDPLGRSVSWNNEDNYIVRAIIEDPYQATHMHFEALASFSTLESINPYRNYINTLYAFVTFNYVKLHEGFSPDEVKSPLDSLVLRHMGDGMKESGAGFDFYLQPVRDIYLHSHLRHELRDNGNVNNLYIFSSIAFFILLIACINFITLSTARAARRSLEVGIRKVFGADRKRLIMQLLIESLIMSFAGMLLAVVLIEIIMPEMAQLAGSSFSIAMSDIRGYLIILFGITAIVGLLSGIYPAYVISAYNPVGIMQKRLAGGYKTAWFRNIMVVVQFIITIVLISGTIVIFLQLDHVKSQDAGISLEEKVVIPLRGRAMVSRYDDVKAKLMTLPGIEDVTASSAYPGNFQQRAGFYPEGSARNDMWMLQNVQVDHNYLEVMEINLIEGQGFSVNAAADSLNVIVNEALVREAGWKEAIGKYIGIPMGEETNDIKLNVIGVVQDFYYASMHETIKPLLMMHDPARLANITVKLSSNNTTASLNAMEEAWDEIFPAQPFRYFFLKEEFEQLYASDIKLSGVFTWFTVLAIFIAGMGLLGLSSYMTGQRTREIGIRKVMGSSSLQIVLLLIRSFLILILVAAVIAIPLSWYGMNEWLNSFANQTPIFWWIFVLSAAMAMLVALSTVIAQSLSAANKNPVDAIRWE